MKYWLILLTNNLNFISRTDAIMTLYYFYVANHFYLLFICLVSVLILKTIYDIF
jgi:hypothetical protein